MKKRLKCIIIFTIFVIFGSFGVRAEAAHESEYLIKQNGGEYTLFRISEEGEAAQISSSDLSELILLTRGGKVFLDGIISDKPLYIHGGEYRVSGKARFSDILEIQQSASVALDGAEFDFSGENSYIKVKGGVLSVKDSTVYSEDAHAVLLNYSSSASLFVESGKILSEESFAIRISEGSATVVGGNVSSSSSAAIYNSSTLTLAGAPVITGSDHDVLSERPISLSYAEKNFSSPLRLQYFGSFTKGSMTEIFRTCSEESISDCQVFDADGVKWSLRYFESTKHSSEKFFAAVYLPYSVRLFDSGNLIDTLYFLEGEHLGEIPPPQKTGYDFVAWYSDEEKTVEVEGFDCVISDTDIYASYKLESPMFVIHSEKFVYDGKSHVLNFSSLTHPLSSEGRFGYEWYKDGLFIGNYEEGVALLGVSDSGRYSCKITFYHGNESVCAQTPELSVEIIKQTVELPKISSAEYSGRFQYSGLKSNEYYTVSDSGGIDVGKYYITLTLRDSENYCFATNDGCEATAEFLIEKAKNYWTSTPSVKNVYINSAARHSAYAAFGEAVFLYSNSPGGVYTSEIPSAAGECFAIATVAETENYSGLQTDPIPFSVLEERVISLLLVSAPVKNEYVAFEEFDPNGIALLALYNSGREEILGGEELGVRYQTAENLRFGDSAVNVSFMGVELSVPISVRKADYDVSGIVFCDRILDYDSLYHEISYSGILPVGADGIPLGASVSSGGRDAGVYKLRLRFESESKNYNLPEEKTATLTIKAITVEVDWGELEFIYDSTPKKPDAAFTDVSGRVVALSVYGAVTNATDNATATVSEPNGNYIFSNPSVTFKVERARYNFDLIEWTYEKTTYDGERKTVTLGGLPEGVFVIGYTDNSAVISGKYRATASLRFDERNYYPPDDLIHEWEILPAEYDVSGVLVENTSAVFDGKVHYPKLSGVMPIGKDGISLEYEICGGASHVSEGIQTVEIRFYTKSKNYVAPKSMYATVEITPAPIYVAWSYTEALFDGAVHSPTAESEFCEILVSGGSSAAGSHVAVANSANPDYEVVNREYEFTISKAENEWVVYPSILSCYESDGPHPHGEAVDGEVEFLYFSDRECTDEKFLPLSVGKYYMKAFVKSSENYLYLESDPIEFEVLAVFAVDFFIDLTERSYAAFSRVNTSDFTAYAILNNGDSIPILSENVNISYQNGDSFRFSDECFTAEWNGFSVSESVIVFKAKYDMSAVLWADTEHEFDGGEKYPLLLNLPEGVVVVDYVGCGISAGEYTVRPIFDYDSDNYEEPNIESCVMKISKQRLAAPTLLSVVYSGQNLAPISNSPLYRFEISSLVNAGKYDVKVVVNDFDNFTFPEGRETVVSFEILKKSIELSVSDIQLYRHMESYFPAYSTGADESLLSSLGLYFVEEGDLIYVKTDDPNYEIVCEPGKIIRLDRLSPKTVTLISAVSLFAALILLVAVLLIFYRRKILHVLAAARCRRAFASGKVIEPVPFLLQKSSDKPIEPVLEKSTDEDVKNDEEVIDGTEDISLKALSAEEELVISVNAEHADSLITDSLAKNLIKDERETIYTNGRGRDIVNVDTLSENFSAGERVDVNALKRRRLVDPDTAFVKVLARGEIDKPLSVHANAFSLSAVKMIALTGGEAVKVATSRKREEKNKGFSEDY